MPSCFSVQSLLRCRWAPGCIFPLAFLLQVAIGLAAALEHMHYKGVAHGDVYAHNVLADEEGKVHLCDYGELALEMTLTVCQGREGGEAYV